MESNRAIEHVRQHFLTPESIARELQQVVGFNLTKRTKLHPDYEKTYTTDNTFKLIRDEKTYTVTVTMDK